MTEDPVHSMPDIPGRVRHQVNCERARCSSNTSLQTTSPQLQEHYLSVVRIPYLTSIGKGASSVSQSASKGCSAKENQVSQLSELRVAAGHLPREPVPSEQIAPSPGLTFLGRLRLAPRVSKARRPRISGSTFFLLTFFSCSDFCDSVRSAFLRPPLGSAADMAPVTLPAAGRRVR